MKLKEVDRNGNITFSPRHLTKTYLAVGTASQQLDASFNTNAQIEIFEFNPSNNVFDMKLTSATTAESRTSKLLWSEDTLVCAEESGALTLYDTNKLINPNEASTAKIISRKSHNGSIYSMDINKYKNNLLATGGSESDIYIWDLEKMEEPMTPGQKVQPYEDVISLAWNHKVQNILGSVSSHRCQIWDLRKTDPVIKLSDTQMKMKPKKILWHPEISTRLCLASGDDHMPVIQMWDLRYIQCPYHVLTGHMKSVQDIDWSLDDPDLLMSIGKDNMMLGYDTNTQHHQQSATSTASNDVVYEWLLDQHYLNEVKLCPRHPGIVAVSSFDCHIGLYSLLGGRTSHSALTGDALCDLVNDSFPLDLNDAQENDLVKKEAEKVAELQFRPTPYLKKAPKWLKRSCGARFSFGGKLTYYSKPELGLRTRENSTSSSGSGQANDGSSAKAHANNQQPSSPQYQVCISQVVSEPELLVRSQHLTQLLSLDVSGSNNNTTTDQSQMQLRQFCLQQARIVLNSTDISVHSLLGHIWNFIECHFAEDSRSAFIENLGIDSKAFQNHNETVLDNDDTGDIDEPELELDNFDLVSINGNSHSPDQDEQANDLSRALMTGNIELAVMLCLKQQRYGEATLLAVSSGQPNLYNRVQNTVIKSSRANYPHTAQLIQLAITRQWSALIGQSRISSWRETLIWLLTYCTTDELGQLCGDFATRLLDTEVGHQGELYNECTRAALVCLIVAGDVHRFIKLYCQLCPPQIPNDYQTIVELIIIMCKAVGGSQDMSSILQSTYDDYSSEQMLLQYLQLICQQGNLAVANQLLDYLGYSSKTPTTTSQASTDTNNFHILYYRLNYRTAQPPFDIRPIFSCQQITQKQFKRPSLPHKTPHFSSAANNLPQPIAPSLPPSNWSGANQMSSIPPYHASQQQQSISHMAPSVPISSVNNQYNLHHSSNLVTTTSAFSSQFQPMSTSIAPPVMSPSVPKLAAHNLSPMTSQQKFMFPIPPQPLASSQHSQSAMPYPPQSLANLGSYPQHIMSSQVPQSISQYPNPSITSQPPLPPKLPQPSSNSSLSLLSTLNPPSISNYNSSNFPAGQSLANASLQPQTFPNFNVNSTPAAFPVLTNSAPLSAWNDPPILSDNYVTDKDGNASDGQNTSCKQSFYNPGEFDPGLGSRGDVPPSAFNNTNILNQQYYQQQQQPQQYPNQQYTGFNPSSNYVINNNNHTVSNASTGSAQSNLTASCSIEQLAPHILEIYQCLDRFIAECKSKDNSRATKVKMDDYHKKLEQWAFHHNTSNTSHNQSDLMLGLREICNAIDSRDLELAASLINNLAAKLSFTEAGQLLPSLKMLVRNSKTILDRQV